MGISQVIEILPGGTIIGLERREKKALDLKQFGRAKIERVSEILFDETRQLWFIKTTTAAPVTLRTHVINRAILERCDFNATAMAHCPTTHPDCPAYFESYDEAVLVEVSVLDHWRLKGW